MSGLPVAFGNGVGLRPMVVTNWSHLWVVFGPARRLLMAEWCPGRLQGLTKGWDGQCQDMGWVVFFVKDSVWKG